MMTVTIKNITEEQWALIKQAVLEKQSQYQAQAELCGRAWKEMFIAEEKFDDA